MLNLQIKEEYQSTIVGFNGSGLPLSKRTDLHLLAEMAQYDKGLAKYFVQLPTPEEIAAYKEELFLKAHPATAPVQEEVNLNTEEQHQ